jgi:hypothetical protein
VGYPKSIPPIMLEKGEAMTLLKKNTQKLKVLNKQERQQFGIKKGEGVLRFVVANSYKK